MKGNADLRVEGYRYRVVCLVARHCGVTLLDYLLAHPNISVVGVFSHSKRPRSESPERAERPEFSLIRGVLNGKNIPLHVVDDPAAATELTGLNAMAPFDFLLSLSWRFLVPARFLSLPRLASINLHRGLLPKYAGAEPVRRMLEDGLTQATITAHVMEEVIDAGEILHEHHMPMDRLPGESIHTAVERIKQGLDPLYPLTAVRAMNKVLAKQSLPVLKEEGVR